MKKMYALLTAILFVSAPAFALRLYVKNGTKDKMLKVALPDDKSAANSINAKIIEPGKEATFSTTLIKPIYGPLRFAVVEGKISKKTKQMAKKIAKKRGMKISEIKIKKGTATRKTKGKAFWETRVSYLFPFKLELGKTANRRFEIGFDEDEKIFKVRRVPFGALGKMFRKKQKWVKCVRITGEDW